MWQQIRRLKASGSTRAVSYIHTILTSAVWMEDSTQRMMNPVEPDSIIILDTSIHYKYYVEINTYLLKYEQQFDVGRYYRPDAFLDK